MKNAAILLLLLLVPVIGCTKQTASGITDDTQDKSVSTDELVAKLSSPQITAAEMRKIEVELIRLDSRTIVPLLLPKIAQGMPSGPIWNGSGSAEGDAEAPPQWRAFYSYRRIWNQVAGRDSKLTGDTLASRLAAISSLREQAMIISELQSFWVDAAEDSVASILHDYRNTKSAWFPAARCLMRHKTTKYYEDVKEILKQLPADPWERANTKANLLKLLLSDRATAYRRHQNGIRRNEPFPPSDRDLVTIGFELLSIMEAHRKGFGYFLALDLADYVGHRFKPDQHDPKYQGKHGLNDDFFVDCAQNGINWWRSNKQKYLQEFDSHQPSSHE